MLWSAMAPGWPAYLRDGAVTLRPLRRRDAQEWRRLRAANADWLRPWEATSPVPAEVPVGYGGMLSFFRSEARHGRMLPFAVVYDGMLAGQVTVSGIARGSLRSASVGYWIDGALAGRGIIPVGVALAVDHCLGPAGLHRVEINIRPENSASLRVVEKLGFRYEGMRARLIHIDGAWRDHLAFAVTKEDVPDGLLARTRVLRSDTPERRA